MSIQDFTKVVFGDTKTQNLSDFEKDDLSIYESINIMGKRANQIQSEIKRSFEERLVDVVSRVNTLDDVEENVAQIELSKKFEAIPKPTNLAIDEFLHDKIYYRNPDKED